MKKIVLFGMLLSQILTLNAIASTYKCQVGEVKKYGQNNYVPENLKAFEFVVSEDKSVSVYHVTEYYNESTGKTTTNKSYEYTLKDCRKELADGTVIFNNSWAVYSLSLSENSSKNNYSVYFLSGAQDSGKELGCRQNLDKHSREESSLMVSAELVNCVKTK